MAEEAKERRRYARVPLSGNVIVIGSGEVRTHPARDVGAGGIFVFAEKAPAVGSRVRVEFDADQDRHVSVSGTVIRHDTASPPHGGPGFAVAFDLPVEVQTPIANALPGA